MGALTAACLLAKKGLKCLVLEQNYLPGGCTSSYWRKGFVFESGATTLVGLDENMPLHRLLAEIGVEINPTPLELPMQVYLKNGAILNRYQNLDAWIAEAERVFGTKNQRPFWEFCYQVSQFVWQTSLLQTAFPPTRLSDFWRCARQVNFQQLRYAPYAFYSTDWLLRKFKLHHNQDFVDFVNEQLMITAQNHASEVNVLFGATALCYTNYGNYYMTGGLINLVNPLIAYLENNGSIVKLREEVMLVEKIFQKYQISTSKEVYQSNFLVSGLPINNTLKLYTQCSTKKASKILGSEYLNSAFQMGIGFRKENDFQCIHHQIHLDKPLPQIGSKSIFVSLNHPSDTTRTDEKGQMVASVSTHIPNPAHTLIENKAEIENVIITTLEEKGFLNKDHIIYQHSSSQKAWQKWTGREFGFVGGYPQLRHIKPWQMLDSRLDGHKAYICGDTTYPGQGIPGTVLSGIIAFEKLTRDWKV